VPKDPGLSVGDSRDADERQIGPRQALAHLTSGRKRAATSAALGSDSRSKTPTVQASRADFPKDHWQEPQSNILPLTPVAPTPHQCTVSPDITGNDSSPMRINSPPDKAKSRVISTGSSPISSSPVLQNALLWARRANDAWLGRQGLQGPGSDFRPPYFVPSLTHKDEDIAARASQTSKPAAVSLRSISESINQIPHITTCERSNPRVSILRATSYLSVRACIRLLSSTHPMWVRKCAQMRSL
jgi:hypothetical protein